jgi:hypothetical protein
MKISFNVKFFNSPCRVLMLETYAPLDKVMEYYGSEERPGGHFPFNFLLISDLSNDSNAYDFDAAIHKWMDNMPEGRWANWVVSDHVDDCDIVG